MSDSCDSHAAVQPQLHDASIDDALSGLAGIIRPRAKFP
ncbi:MAG: hypothetical protein ACOVOE_16980 [Caulobacter sp.]